MSVTVAIAIFLAVLPPDQQDVLIDTVVPAIWGGIVVGFGWLWAEHFTAAVGPVVFFTAAYLVWSANSARKRRIAAMATKAPAGPIEALLGKLLRSQQREFIAETSGVAVTGAGVEGGVEFATADDYAGQGGAISTNPILGTSNRREEREARARAAQDKAAARAAQKEAAAREL